MGFLSFIISPIANVFSSWFGSKTAASNAAATEAQANATITQADDSLAASTELETTSRFKEIVITIILFPFFLNYIWPSKAAAIFTSMHNMPSVYLEECFLIVNILIGVKLGSEFTKVISNGFQDFVSAKGKVTLAKANIDKQAFYDALAHLKGTVSPEEQQDISDTIDSLNKEG